MLMSIKSGLRLVVKLGLTWALVKPLKVKGKYWLVKLTVLVLTSRYFSSRVVSLPAVSRTVALHL